MNLYKNGFGDFGNDHMLTNFNRTKLNIYQEAVKKYGDNTLYISDVAYDDRNNVVKDHMSLRSTEYKDRHDFWELFKEIKNGD